MGLDLSLTRSGVYLGPGEFAELKGGRLRGTDRLRFLSDALFNMLDGWDVRDAIIEGYAFGATARHHRIGEWGGAARVALSRAGVKRIIEVPPSTLKKWATGSGRASKEDMVEAAVARCGHSIPSHDVADACLLWYAGADNNLIRTKCSVEDVH